MHFNSELLSVLVSIATSVFVSGIAYGAMKAKMEAMHDAIKSLDEESKVCPKNYVTNSVFNATIDPIRSGLSEMRGDIKKILVFLSQRSSRVDHHDDEEE